MQTMFDRLEIKTIKPLYNNAYQLDDFIICGSRGWFVDKSQQNVVGEVDYEKIVNREIIRLKISLDEGKKLQAVSGLPILVFLHFPPVWNGFICNEIVDLLLEYDIKKCYFGHIHGNYTVQKKFIYNGIEMILTSADFLNFAAMPIFPEK